MRKSLIVLATLALLPLASARAGEATIADLEQRVKALEDVQAKPAANPLKLGIVSEEEVLDNLEEKKEIDVEIELVEQEARKTLAAIQKECLKIEAEIELRAQGSDDRARKVKELDVKKEELAVKYKNLYADIQQMARKQIDDLRSKIRTNIERYARQHNYSLVIEKRALLYGEEGDTLTTKIIDQMNGEHFANKADKEDEKTETPGK